MAIVSIIPIEVSEKLPDVYRHLFDDINQKEGEIEVSQIKGRWKRAENGEVQIMFEGGGQTTVKRDENGQTHLSGKYHRDRGNSDVDINALYDRDGNLLKS